MKTNNLSKSDRIALTPKKSIIMTIVIATFLVCVPTVMAGDYDQDMITLNIVDKNNVTVSIYYGSLPYTEGYTDKTGRLTFPNLDVDGYDVHFSWKGETEDKGEIKVTNKSGIKTFTLTFDESQLDEQY